MSSSTAPRGSLFGGIGYYLLALIATAFFAFPIVWMTLSSLKSDVDISAYPP
ncbi:carbohydrate ABC transporter permease, partial [Mesorhizobium sp. M2D.F.Ca.ET.145.01.1.1]